MDSTQNSAMLKLLIVLMLKESEHQVVKNLIFPRGSGIDYGEKCHENLVKSLQHVFCWRAEFSFFAKMAEHF